VAGLLATIPLLCMGAFAAPSSALGARIGSRLAIGGGIVLITAAGMLRAVMPGAAGVILLTVPIGIGIAVAGTVMPVAVKERVPDRPAFGTSVYATGISVGAALAAALAVPLAGLGSWRTSLFLLSLAGAVVAAIWLVQTRSERHRRRASLPRVPLPWRNPLAWTLVAMFSLLATMYYGMSSWLPDSYVERGWSDASAGGLLGALNIAAIPGTFLIGALAERHGSRRLVLVVCSAITAVAVTGTILAPGAGWVWAVAYGFVNGGVFALMMTLPLDLGERPADAGAVAAMMLGVGYTVGALAPFVLGGIRDLTGSFTASLWILAVAAVAFLGLSCLLSAERLRRRRVATASA
jgi:CP family cyanate transporter-like MFS transporter